MNHFPQEALYRVILQPHVSEKSTDVADRHKQFVFRVIASATKHSVKSAVEKLFAVKVKSVQLCNVKGKEKRFAQMTGTRTGYKKAYVSLVEGDIDFSRLPKDED